MTRFIVISLMVGVFALLIWLIERDESPRAFSMLAGEVRDDRGPVAGAVVRVKGRAEFVLSGNAGRFQLTAPTGALRVTASKDGYFITGASAQTKPLLLQLHRLPESDCEHYAWVDPTPDRERSLNCGNCHRAIYDEWRTTGHAQAAANQRFLNLYDGTDWHGNPNVGWNLLKDHETGAGVCSSCHAPTQPPGEFAEFDFRAAGKGSAGLTGIHCDFCHKVRGPGAGEFGLAHGKYQLSLLRPSEKDLQLFFGPLDDVDRGDDVHSRFQRDSRLCAACHEGIVFGVPVYTTYSEWLVSPASQSGTSCQSCHLAPTGKMANIAPGKGGIQRDPWTLGNHRFFDGSQLDMLRRCLKLEIAMRRTTEGVQVDVALSAQMVGHRVPTGFIDRQVILRVEAYAGDQRTALIRGPVLPDVLGAGEAGQPGRLYAKVLRDEKGRGPAPFWQADPSTLQDTRLHPGKTDRSSFIFPAQTEHVRVRLVHRRFWRLVAEEKHWPTDEQVIEDQVFRISG